MTLSLGEYKLTTIIFALIPRRNPSQEKTPLPYKPKSGQIQSFSYILSLHFRL